jgi:hypothetical protein
MDPNHWNDRYATDDYVWKADPNVFLVEEVVGLPVGPALDLACGEGRNAVWLAEQGWTVTGVDFLGGRTGQGPPHGLRPTRGRRLGVRRRHQLAATR